MKRCLVISVHPDDETLGCGGTLLKLGRQGIRLDWLIVTRAWTPAWTASVIRAKAGEVQAVAKAYGMASVRKLGLPTTRLDRVPAHRLIAALAGAVREVRPDTVFLVHGGDVHTDHRLVFEAAASVFKRFRLADLGVERILSYETLSSTGASVSPAALPFLPTVYSDITGLLEDKLRVMALYRTEVQPDPLPRGPEGIRSLARQRGATVGLEHAEAFMLLHEFLA
jgi:LmbE family N-acetylglucosaminyl deacetylase